MKKITQKQILEAVEKLNEASYGKKFEGWIGTPYGIVSVFNDKSFGDTKAIRWLKKRLK